MLAQNNGGFSVVIDPQQWYRFKKELDAFDPALARALRKRIRDAGKVAAEAVKKKLSEASPAGGDNSGEGRAALIAATRVSVTFGKRVAGSRIVTSGSKLPAAHQGLLKVYNKRTFRHPVFARKGAGKGSWDGTWVAQKGNPYFGTVIRRAMNRAVVDEIASAVDEAYRAIGAKAI